ncbi:MAG: helix-turn-helix domain-containing protein [Acutalibacteraceae bacterium]
MPTLFTEHELSKFLKVSSVTLYRLRLSGMPCLRVGGQLRYDLDAVLEWLQSEKEEVKHG